MHHLCFYGNEKKALLCAYIHQSENESKHSVNRLETPLRIWVNDLKYVIGVLFYLLFSLIFACPGSSWAFL